MDWEQHKYMNKLGYYWINREELTKSEKSQLKTRMTLNY